MGAWTVPCALPHAENALMESINTPMTQAHTPTAFKAKLHRPVHSGGEQIWAFVVLPKNVSETLPRRGRCTVVGTLNGCPFQSLLEPDGQLSHWLKIDSLLLEASATDFGDTVSLTIAPAAEEPEPDIPSELQQALHDAPAAWQVWQSTSIIARLDWIHWIESAKQAKTRAKRIADACDMLAQGKRRVCCFDTSGYYSKALSAPKSIDE